MQEFFRFAQPLHSIFWNWLTNMGLTTPVAL
jgi:hypothetical protein